MVHRTYTDDVLVVGGGIGGTAVTIQAARDTTFSKIQGCVKASVTLYYF